jgi:hypothetical protein
MGGEDRGHGSPLMLFLFSEMIFKQTVSTATGSVPATKPWLGVQFGRSVPRRFAISALRKKGTTRHPEKL